MICDDDDDQWDDQNKEEKDSPSFFSAMMEVMWIMSLGAYIKPCLGAARLSHTL